MAASSKPEYISTLAVREEGEICFLDKYEDDKKNGYFLGS